MQAPEVPAPGAGAPGASAPGWEVVVLSGGRGSRLGGAVKADVAVGGRTSLERLLLGIPDGVAVTVAGPESDVDRPVRFVREDPPFAGPVAGLAAALSTVHAPVVVVFGADMPDAGPLAGLLAQACAQTSHDVVVAVDADGRRQPLCAAYRVDALRAAIAELGGGTDIALRAVLAKLSVLELMPSAQQRAMLTDIDTREDLRSARKRHEGSQPVLDGWITAVRDELGLSTMPMSVDTVLDIARFAAHDVERPAAPVTTFLAGVAVANGQDPALVAERLEALAAAWKAKNES